MLLRGNTSFCICQIFLVTKRNLVLGGDFNCVENLSLDKKGGNLSAGDIGSSDLRQWRQDFELVDCFRVKNNSESVYMGDREWEG